MRLDYRQIGNHESVIRHLGGWPSFDDFEVTSMLLDREGHEEGVGPSLTIRFSGFRPGVAAESRERNNCLLTLRFTDCENLTLAGFNHQNAINGLVVLPQASELIKRLVFNVKLVQGFGVGCAFDCSAIEVLAVTPLGANDKPAGV